jgi:hypothetical protein
MKLALFLRHHIEKRPSEIKLPSLSILFDQKSENICFSLGLLHQFEKGFL